MSLRDDAESYILKAKDPTKELRGLLLYAAFLVFFIYISFLLNSVIFSSVYVDGPSMQPTLNTGDILYINKWKKPQHGDIVVIQVRSNSKPYIKRVIGLEGDTLKYSGGKMYIKYSGNKDFQLICEVNSTLYSGLDSWVIPDVITVGKNEVFFLGDNRTNSDDSTENGCRTLGDIVGVVTKWSLEHKKTLTTIYNIFSI